MATSSHGPSQVTNTAGFNASFQHPTYQPPPSLVGPTPQLPQLNLNDLRAIATDIKNTLSAAITDLCHDIQALLGIVQEVEKTVAHDSTALRHMHQAIDTHTLQLNCHMEDLDNRGRRHNLIVWGLPESVEPGQLTQTVASLFNNFLDRSPTPPIEL